MKRLQAELLHIRLPIFIVSDGAVILILNFELGLPHQPE